MDNKLSLNKDEKIINFSRLHYFVLLQYTLMGIILSVAILLLGKSFLPVNFLVILSVFIMLGLVYAGFLEYKKTAAILTTERFIYFETEGLLYRSRKEIPVGSIKTFSLEKANPIGHLLDFGTIKIQVPGGEASEIVIGNIARPEKLDNAMSDLFAGNSDQIKLDNPIDKINFETKLTIQDYTILVIAACMFAVVVYFVAKNFNNSLLPLENYFKQLFKI